MFFKRTVDLHTRVSCIPDCIEYLTGCKSGKYSSDEQWEGLLKYANEVFSYGLEHGFVICGDSPDGRHARDVLQNFYHQNVIFADWDDARLEVEKNPERAFILASKKFCAKYTIMLEKAPFYLNYNHLWILNPHFHIGDLQFYGGEYVKERMEAVAENADTLLKMLNNFEDQDSKELLAHALLYRVTLDDRYAVGVKSDEPQYFDHNLISLGTDTIFVDAGGYNGDTLRDFMNVSGGQFEYYYFFEPVPALLAQAEAGVTDPRIEFLPYCLWDRDETVSFTECASNNMSGYAVQGMGGVDTNAVSLDHFLDGKPVTFIKMDIEGAEMRALRGAENSIKAYRPTLAISAYHMPNDLADIYLFCESIGGYRLYLRTTEYNLDYELTLYAIKENKCL